jgi:hypothetical protein
VTALSDAIVQLRIDLDDQDAGDYRWTDAELTEHINRALYEFSEECPREQKSSVTTTPGSRDLGISTLTNRVRILAVEYPTAQYPPIYVLLRLGDTLTMLIDDPPPAPSHLRLLHIPLLDVTTSLTTQDKNTVLGGAWPRAAQLASANTEAISSAPNTDKDYAPCPASSASSAPPSGAAATALAPSTASTPANPPPPRTQTPAHDQRARQVPHPRHRTLLPPDPPRLRTPPAPPREARPQEDGPVRTLVAALLAEQKKATRVPYLRVALDHRRRNRLPETICGGAEPPAPRRLPRTYHQRLRRLHHPLLPRVASPKPQ